MGRFRSDYAGIEFFHLFLQLLAQALQFRQAGPPAAAHFADQPNQFPAVEGHVKITAEGIRQDKPRVLPGNSRCAEPVVKGEQLVHSGNDTPKADFPAVPSEQDSPPRNSSHSAGISPCSEASRCSIINCSASTLTSLKAMEKN